MADDILLPFCVWSWAINNELACEKDLIESRWLVSCHSFGKKKTEKKMQYWAVIEILFTKFIETKFNKSYWEIKYKIAFL